MSFFEFNIAMSGLFASQRGLQVTSNNITNANTAGYSRQVLGQKADNPLGGLGVGMLGTGVTTTGISRVRDSYIDSKLWSQNPRYGEYNIKVTQNSLIEAVYGEPSDEGFTAVFNDMFNGLSNLSKDPSSKDAQTAFRQELINYTKYYNNITGSLQKYQQDLNYQLKATVQEVNTLATRIQSLNKQIFEAEIYGGEANSFRDERDLCIDRLSQIGNVEIIEYQEDVNGQTTNRYKVKFEGQSLVDHFNANTLSVEVRGQAEEKINGVVTQLEAKYGQLTKLTVGSPEYKAVQDEITQLQKDIKEINKNVVVENDGSIKYSKNGVTTEVLKINADNTTVVTALGDGKINSEDADDLYDIVWDNGMPFNMSSSKLSGELKGIIDMRDGCGTNSDVEYNGIPYYIQRMDNYVRQFAQSMNEQYSTNKDGNIEIDPFTSTSLGATYAITSIKKDDKGNITGYYDAKGNEITGLSDADKDAINQGYTTKYKLFSYKTNDTQGESTDGDDLVGDNYAKLTSSNFSISKEIFDGVENMRTTYDESDPSDTRFLLKLLGQKDNKHMFKEGDPKDYMISIFSELGIGAKEAKMYQSTQKSVTDTIINQRLAVSQVDQTEEFTMLIKYQQAYQASAKIMNTIDGIYETTIFKLGNF